MSPAASAQEVTAAFRRFALRNHPDRGGDPERFRVGAEAYRRILSPGRPDACSGPVPRSEGRSGPVPRSEGRSGPRADVVFHRRTRPGVGALLRRARLTLVRPRS